MPNTREKEKLVELLQAANAATNKAIDEDRVEDREDAWKFLADHLIANGVTVQGWIPVSEKLPEKEGTYLTYTVYERIHIDCFCIYPNHGTQFWVCGNGKVTHWMPLPQPPKGE